MLVVVNGENRDIAPDSTVASLLQELGLPNKAIVVQRNDDILERASFADIQLNEGDVLDLIKLVGGG